MTLDDRKGTREHEEKKPLRLNKFVFETVGQED